MMRTRILLAALASLASTGAGAVEQPRLEISAHYGEMYAGRTYIDVDFVGVHDVKRQTIQPEVRLELRATQNCTDGGCTTSSTMQGFGDPGPLIGVLNAARGHLAASTDFTYHLDDTLRECGGNPGIDIQVDGKAHRMRLTLSSMTAEFDPDEVDYFLGLVQPAYDRLLLMTPQFDAFNAASPLTPANAPPPRKCGDTAHTCPISGEKVARSGG